MVQNLEVLDGQSGIASVDSYLATLRRVAKKINLSCLMKKPNKPKKAKDLKLQYSTTKARVENGTPHCWMRAETRAWNFSGGFRV